MSKTVEKTATVETAFGQKLDNPIEFDYSYVELASGDEIPAKEMPDADDLISFVNQARNAKARSSAQAEAFKLHKIIKPDLTNADFRLASMVKILVKAGNSEAQATQIAKSALGL